MLMLMLEEMKAGQDYMKEEMKVNQEHIIAEIKLVKTGQEVIKIEIITAVQRTENRTKSR